MYIQPIDALIGNFNKKQKFVITLLQQQQVSIEQIPLFQMICVAQLYTFESIILLAGYNDNLQDNSVLGIKQVTKKY
jgi:hypothetical protein